MITILAMYVALLHTNKLSILTIFFYVFIRYNLMLESWQQLPGARPTFSDLVSDLDRILALSSNDVSIYNYIKFSVLSLIFTKGLLPLNLQI